MSDVIYVLLTLAVFIALSLLVGVLDRHSGAVAAPAADHADHLASGSAPAGDRGVR